MTGKTGVTQLEPRKGKDGQQQPEAGKKYKHFPRDFRENKALLMPQFQISGIHNCERKNFCCFQPFNWGYLLWKL